MREWLVTADDRTGAYEVAAEIATVVGPVSVTVHHAPDREGVVDIDSRHRPVDAAIDRVRAMPAARWNAHKIDSTLRGNWAEEVRARTGAIGRRALVVAAWPAMGRTCTEGVVHVHGNPVGDVSEHLPEVHLLADLDALHRWLAGDSEFGCIDVADTAAMTAVADAVATHEVLVVGPAGPIGAVFGARAVPVAGQRAPRCEAPALVVLGSATDLSRVQVDRLRQIAPHVDVLAAPPAGGQLRPEVADQLAERVRTRRAERDYATVVIIGGDTAAAVLGPAPRIVGGTVRPGMPYSRDMHGRGPLVITKAGGFGDPDALVELFRYGA